MSLFSPLLVVCQDPEQAVVLSGFVRALGYPDAHIVADGFPAAIQALGSRTTSPEYIIIDISGHGADIFPALDEFALHCEPNVRVVVLGTINDIHFYRDIKQRGVLEYFAHPVQPADIRAILIQGPAPYQPPVTSAQQGTVISCMCAASGDGSSTLALNLAYCLATEHKQSVVLVDMDYQFGLISKSLDLSAPFGIRELFDHPERGLDEMLVGKMLVSYKNRLDIIAAPSELKLLPTIRPELIRELVAILRSKYSFVILDIPHIWTDWTAAALTYSDHAVMVAQLWLRSLTHSSRLLTAWQAIGVERDDVSLVINRSGSKYKEEVSVQDFERICRHKITTHINNDVKAITYAENNAQTLFENDQGRALSRQVGELAQLMMERFAGAAAQQHSAVSEPKRGLLSFSIRKKE